MFVLSAAGFIATSTLGASPGVRMSKSAKWSWKPETPGSEPAGARISAGKSGSVEMSFPSSAVSEVNCEPVSCMPSPESPAKRTITCESCSTGLDNASGIAKTQAVRGRVEDEHAVLQVLRLLPGVGDAADGPVELFAVGDDDRRVTERCRSLRSRGSAARLPRVRAE